MDEIVICDTNAAIHLAIICPEVLKTPDVRCKIVIHSIVKQEVHKLNQNEDKKKRLGIVLDFLLKEVTTDSKTHLPSKDKEIKHHRRIQKFEGGLDPQFVSSGSSHQDRCFLILAKEHEAKLLTNEKTLFNLGIAFLGAESTWRTSSAIEKLLELEIITQGTVQEGLNSMSKFEEELHSECKDKVRSLGFIC